jgi:hypothetical protein
MLVYGWWLFKFSIKVLEGNVLPYLNRVMVCPSACSEFLEIPLKSKNDMFYYICNKQFSTLIYIFWMFSK